MCGYQKAPRHQKPERLANSITLIPGLHIADLAGSGLMALHTKGPGMALPGWCCSASAAQQLQLSKTHLLGTGKSKPAWLHLQTRHGQEPPCQLWGPV